MDNKSIGSTDLKKLPYAGTDFDKLRSFGKIYVDKTEMIYKLTLFDSAPVFLARPRRFGKSLLISTFESLFSRGTTDFKDLAIEKLWGNEKTYRVLHMDFSKYADMEPEELKKYLTKEIADFFSDKKTLPVLDEQGNYNDPGYLLSQVHAIAEKSSLVLLIDEYDAPVTHHLSEPAKQRRIIDLLSSFFASMKACERIFRFVFITGITRIAHVSLFSMVNNLKDISIHDDYSSLLGITEDELHKYFDPYVNHAASELNIKTSEVYRKLKSTYNGFQFSPNAKETVYNPWSLLSFLVDPKQGFQNYWYDSSGGTPTILINYLRDPGNFLFFNNVKKKDIIVSIERLKLKSDSGQLPMDLLLFHTGYLTMRYQSSRTVKLELPNDEVSDSIINVAMDANNIQIKQETITQLDQIPALIDQEKIREITDIFNTVLTETISDGSNAFEYENIIRDIIYSQLPDRGMLKSRETVNAFGRADMEMTTSKIRLTIEFKRSYKGKSEKRAIEEATEQIRSHHYGETTLPKKLIRVAMVISTVKRCISAFRIIE